MDWFAETKMLNKALKQARIEKARLEASIKNSDQDNLKYYSTQIIKKELVIQNLEFRLGLARSKSTEDNKKA